MDEINQYNCVQYIEHFFENDPSVEIHAALPFDIASDQGFIYDRKTMALRYENFERSMDEIVDMLAISICHQIREETAKADGFRQFGGFEFTHTHNRNRTDGGIDHSIIRCYYYQFKNN